MVDRADPLTPPGPGRRAIAPIGAAQILALAWLLVVPLPSIEAQRLDAQARAADGVGGGGAAGLQSIRRASILLTADEHLAIAAANLSDGEHLGQRLPIVLAALLIGGAAVALGDLASRLLGLIDRFPPLARWPIAFVTGATLLAALTLGAGRLGWLRPIPTRIALGLLVLAGASAWVRDLLARGRSPAISPGSLRPRPADRPSPWPAIGLGLVVGPVLALMALAAMQPTIEYDALEYHLQGPKEHYEAGRIRFLPHNVYTSMPSAVEMLHLLGMLVLDDWWRGALVGQLLIAGFAPASAALIAAAAWRWGSPRAAWFAVLIYLTTPWVFRLAAFPFVEGPLCAYHAALVFAAAAAWSMPRDSIAEGPRPPALWLLAGLLAGGAMACKYPGLVSAVVPFGGLAAVEGRRRRSWRIPAAFAVGAAVAVGPWLLRNVADMGNPVYPLAPGVFGGGDRDPDLDSRWQDAHGPRPVNGPALASALLDVAGRSDWQSPLYAMLAPLALLRRGSRGFAAILAAYVAYLFGTWFLLTHRLDRFWLPLLPAAAVLAGLGADWTRRRPWPSWAGAVVAVATASNLVFLTTPLCGPTDWLGDLGRLRVEAAEAANPPLSRLDASLPPGAKPLLVGQAGVFPVGRPVSYNTVFDRELIEEIAAERSPAEVADEFRRRGISHVYVDWSEIARHRKPGGYGYSSFVTRALFDDLVSSGVLAPPTAMGPDHLLYRVLGPPSTAREDPRAP